MNTTFRKLIIAVLIVAALFGGYTFLTMKDQRTTSERTSDALQEIDRGSDNATRQLEDRTPGQKLGDAVKDAGDRIKSNTAP